MSTAGHGAETRRRARMDAPPRSTRVSSAASARPSTSGARTGITTVVRTAVHAVWLTAVLLLDARTPSGEKLAFAAAVAYLVSPVDLVVDVIPVFGQLDDLALLLWAWRRLVQAAGDDVVEDLWRGDRRSLELLHVFAGTDRA